MACRAEGSLSRWPGAEVTEPVGVVEDWLNCQATKRWPCRWQSQHWLRGVSGRAQEEPTVSTQHPPAAIARL